MGGCCKSKPLRDDRHASKSPATGQELELTAAGIPKLPAPTDDVITDACEFSEAEFAVAGVDGWVHVYDAEEPGLSGRLRAHGKAVNRFLSFGDRLLTASGDATIRVWRKGMQYKGGEGPAEPLLAMQGHELSVRALDLVDGACPFTGPAACSGEDGAPALLFSGSRDCTVRLWDLATGTSLQRVKILRNVVTAIRRVPGEARQAVQASEDLMLRLWDTRSGLRPAVEAQGGPNQIICLDVSDDSRFVIGGTKGFSRENCEVKVFDIRSNLRPLASLACADQAIEVLHLVGRERCLIAAHDGYIRGLAVPELKVVCEHGPSSAGGYTAMGVQRRPGAGPAVLAAAAGPEGAELELLEWPDCALEGEPLLIAATS